MRLWQQNCDKNCLYFHILHFCLNGHTFAYLAKLFYHLTLTAYVLCSWKMHKMCDFVAHFPARTLTLDLHLQKQQSNCLYGALKLHYHSADLLQEGFYRWSSDSCFTWKRWKIKSDWLKGPSPNHFVFTDGVFIQRSGKWKAVPNITRKIDRREQERHAPEKKTPQKISVNSFFFTLKNCCVSREDNFGHSQEETGTHTLYAALNSENCLSTSFLSSFPCIYIHIFHCSIMQA